MHKYLETRILLILPLPWQAMNDKQETLAVIMPVYNEEAAVGTVLREWHSVLSSLGIQFIIKCYNDGSTDRTWDVLNKTSKELDHIKVYNKTNSGHGPTILTGYTTSYNSSWIFQVDSDNEIPASEFHKLWQQRESYDLIIGKRKKSNVPLSRNLISFISQKWMASIYHSRVRDVNSPFRLMRVSKLSTYIDTIPANTFAPNLLITGLAAQMMLRCVEVPVQYRVRKTGQVSIRGFKLIKVSIKSFWETLKFRVISIPY